MILDWSCRQMRKQTTENVFPLQGRFDARAYQHVAANPGILVEELN